MLSDVQENNILQNIELVKHIKTLDDRSRAVIALNMSGYTQAQMAKLLGISRTVIGNIYRKSLESLRELLTKGE